MLPGNRVRLKKGIVEDEFSFSYLYEHPSVQIEGYIGLEI